MGMALKLRPEYLQPGLQLSIANQSCPQDLSSNPFMDTNENLYYSLVTIQTNLKTDALPAQTKSRESSLAELYTPHIPYTC